MVDITGISIEIIALFNSRSDRIDRKFAPLNNWLLMRSTFSQADLQKLVFFPDRFINKQHVGDVCVSLSYNML
ncbi:hypothetical protein RclHR1_01470002 [Rhizophagus clarus]|uniref:Uncharacterized protein n=1 Tax=Rhizophagus clarus TaxID=94130 RepID=A0A2Z6QSN9_9GLOM|nr:hypothetical protein RclHR1_01470002 [Rhizophagus clarus]GES84211.1 hypothetical protein RCL_e2378_RclHR1_01470002 [Rhizophagus clarus]